MLYRVAFEGANLIRLSLVMAAAMLAICLLALVETMAKAEAKDSLPENGRIAFSILQEKGYDIYTVDPDGSNLSLLTNDIDADDQPAWSPDGTKIGFVREGRPVSRGSIWVMDADGSNLRRLNPYIRVVPNTGLAWSPDGTKLAFTGYDDEPRLNSDIYTLDVDSSNKTNITNTPKVDETSYGFSPDGSQICLSRFQRIFIEEGGKVGTYVMNVDATNLTRLTTHKRDHGSGCSWSPDATKIAYQVVPLGLAGPVIDRAEVYIMNADGSEKTNLTNSRGGGWLPEWSPDGTRIAFASIRDGDYDIYTMDADGSDVTQVTNLPGNEQEPDWQPLPRTTVHQPDTGGPSLLLVASALLFSGGVMFYAGLKHRV